MTEPPARVGRLTVARVPRPGAGPVLSPALFQLRLGQLRQGVPAALCPPGCPPGAVHGDRAEARRTSLPSALPAHPPAGRVVPAAPLSGGHHLRCRDRPVLPPAAVPAVRRRPVRPVRPVGRRHLARSARPLLPAAVRPTGRRVDAALPAVSAALRWV